MASNLLKQSKLRADEITHYAFEFAHSYDREYGSPGFNRSYLPKDEMRRILVDKAMNSIPNCDKDSAFRVAIATEKVLETMGITIKMAKTPRTDVYKDQWKKGEKAWFEYHCFESDSSCDADLWHHSHEQVVVLGEADADGSSKRWPDSTPEQRAENGTPRVYRVRFSDGKTFDAAEDELMTSTDGFYRPNPPKRKKAVSEESHQMNMEVNALDPQRDVGAGAGTGEQSPANYMADEGLDEPDKAYHHPFGLGMGTEPENTRYGSALLAAKSKVYETPHADYKFPLTVYRILRLPKGDPLILDNIGIHWTDWKENMNLFMNTGNLWDQQDEGADENNFDFYTLEAKVLSPDDVDWDATIRQNQEEPMEHEVTLNDLTSLQLVSINGKKQTRYITAAKADELPEDKKYTHEEVDYESPSRHEGQTCAGCTMFVAPGSCTGVVSPIKPGDWCHEFEAKKKGFTSSLLQIQAAAKPKCPHCGSTDYGLMPSDFETAKCNKCGKNWDHGIVPGINDPSDKTASGEPPWWNEPSKNVFAKNMTMGEEIMDWLTRHQVPQEGGKYVLYHATPVKGGATTSLRPGSYLAEDPETALHQAGRERGQKSGDLKVAKIYVNPWDIQSGVWARTRNEVPVVEWQSGVNPFKRAAKPGGGIHGDEAVNFYKPTTTLPPRYDQRKHIDENMIDDPIKDDLAADKKKMEGPTPATGHAPLRRDLAQRNFMASEDEYWLDMVNENEANAKKHFMESPDMQQIAQDNGWTMEQTWDEVGRNFCNEFYDPRNRLIATKTATRDANRPNPEAFNQFEACRANLNYLITGEFWRNISDHLQQRLQGIYDDMELLSKDWDAAAGVPPQAHEYDEPKRSPLLDINDVLDPEG